MIGKLKFPLLDKEISRLHSQVITLLHNERNEVIKMAEINLSKYGISGATEVIHNPSYEMLFEEETNPALEGYEKGQVSEF